MEQAETLIKALHYQNKVVKKSKTKPRIIAIASGKGGVGKTNIAINMGIAFSKIGKEVVVMDGDLGLANVNVILGVIPKYNLLSVLKGQKQLHEILIDTPDGIKIIAGASGFSQLADLKEEHRNNFINGLSALDSCDILIIDTSAGVSDNVISFLLAGDEIIIVTTPEPTAITDAYGIIKCITAKSTSASIKLIINRVNSEEEAQKVAERVINISEQFLNIKVHSLGFIYEDYSMAKAVIHQKPFFSLFPHCKAAKNIASIVYKLEKLEVPTDRQGISGFIKNLFNFYKSNN